jgi:tetratricopeptide (TPR) repeat protein
VKPYNWQCAYLGFVFALAAMRPGQAQQDVVKEYRGEIQRRSSSFFHGFVAQLDGLTSRGESTRAEVQSDGSFSFRDVPCGQYRLRITNYRGDTIQQQFVSVTPQTPVVTVQLAEPDAARPPDGAVSFGRLQHPPAPKAFKAYVAAQKLSESGEYEKAARKLEEALRITPEYSDAWTNLAAQHIRMRRFDQAIADAGRAIRIAGPNSVDLCNMALAQWAVHRYPEALDSALRGAELDPSSVKAQYLAGALLADAKRWSEALPHLQFAARSMRAAQQLLEHAPSSIEHSFRP